MPQLFPRWTNSFSRATLGGLAGAVALGATAAGVYVRSPLATNADLVRRQPVPFSHAHHVGGLGIDCRYCHASVETSSYAGMPPTHTCMTCHSQLWTDAAVLAPVREAYSTGAPLAWTRVTRVPDYVFFDHSIHVAKGVGCVECHGRVDLMPMTRAVHSLQMRWCVGCHRDPEPHLRPRAAEFSMDWTPPAAPAAREELGRRLAKEYGVRRLTSCYTCHR